MTCSYCQLAGCCSGIGACAANQKYLKAYLQRHPGKIVSGNLARQICNLGKQEEDARKLKEIKESLYFSCRTETDESVPYGKKAPGSPRKSVPCKGDSGGSMEAYQPSGDPSGRR